MTKCVCWPNLISFVLFAKQFFKYIVKFCASKIFKTAAYFTINFLVFVFADALYKIKRAQNNVCILSCTRAITFTLIFTQFKNIFLLKNQLFFYQITKDLSCFQPVTQQHSFLFWALWGTIWILRSIIQHCILKLSLFVVLFLLEVELTWITALVNQLLIFLLLFWFLEWHAEFFLIFLQAKIKSIQSRIFCRAYLSLRFFEVKVI